MQRGDDLQVRDQRAKLGGRAEVQACTLIDVERLVHAVGLDPHEVRPVAALEQRKAISDFRRIVLRAQHFETVQASGLRALTGGGAREPFADSFLDPVIQGGGCAQVEPVEVVDVRYAERGEQMRL